MTARTGKVTCNLSISVDGYSAGLDQTDQRPFGDDGGDGWVDRLHSWMFDDAEENRAETERLADPQSMDGGTTFHFVTDGIEAALERAREAAGDGDVSIHGGATTINQYLAAGLIDEVRLHIVPLTLGAGTRLFDGVPPLDLQQVESRTSNSVTHLTYRVLPRAARDR